MRSGIKQIPINLTRGGVSSTIICGLYKQGIANVLNLNPRNQHYTAFLTIDDKTNSDKPCEQCSSDHNNSEWCELPY